jgi:hypothetical protein
MEQQVIPVSSSPRRPASDSFDNNGGLLPNISKRHRNNDYHRSRSILLSNLTTSRLVFKLPLC